MEPEAVLPPEPEAATLPPAPTVLPAFPPAPVDASALCPVPDVGKGVTASESPPHAARVAVVAPATSDRTAERGRRAVVNVVRRLMATPLQG